MKNVKGKRKGIENIGKRKLLRKRKKEKMYEELKKKHEEMKKKVDEQQLEINKLKEPLSEINAQADKLAREVSDEAATVNVVNMVSEALGPGMQQRQENFLNKDNKEHDAGNSLLNMPLDLDHLNSLGLEDFRLEGFEDFNELLDSYVSRTKGNEYIDNMTSPKALSGTAIDIPSSSMIKRAKRSEGYKNGELIREGFEMDAKVLAARNVTYKKINTHVVLMPENEIWNLLEKIGIDLQIITCAYVYFINNPEKVRAVLGCPWEYRKEVVEKLVLGSLGH